MQAGRSAALFGGAIGKDVVSRAWRKVRSDWEAWQKRDLAGDDIVRLILDGTVVRVRLDRKATSALGVGGAGGSPRRPEGAARLAQHGWRKPGSLGRALLDDLVARGLATPELLIVDGAAGLEKAVAALWNDVPAPALYGPQAPQPAGPCAKEPLRRGQCRLHRHDLRQDGRRGG